MALRESPVARDTAEIPPHPIIMASLAASSRRVRGVELPDQQIESLLDGFFSFIHAPQSTTLCPALIPLFSDDSLVK